MKILTSVLLIFLASAQESSATSWGTISCNVCDNQDYFWDETCYPDDGQSLVQKGFKECFLMISLRSTGLRVHRYGEESGLNLQLEKCNDMNPIQISTSSVAKDYYYYCKCDKKDNCNQTPIYISSKGIDCYECTTAEDPNCADPKEIKDSASTGEKFHSCIKTLDANGSVIGREGVTGYAYNEECIEFNGGQACKCNDDLCNGASTNLGTMTVFAVLPLILQRLL